jgi:hypothetical protein|tara:strand:- start:4910 stop:5194 length:285 start_codon:yes stop_codon:yes gene_type:complete
MKRKKTAKKAAGFTFWRKDVKKSLLGAFNWVKHSISSSIRKAWAMLLDDSYGLAWGGIVFGTLTLLNVLNPWDLLAILSIGLGVRHLWSNHQWH